MLTGFRAIQVYLYTLYAYICVNIDCEKLSCVLFGIFRARKACEFQYKRQECLTNSLLLAVLRSS